jgi:hypothetical protein
VLVADAGNRPSGDVLSFINRIDMPNPGLRRHEGGSAQRQSRGGAQAIGQAAPRPVLRSPNQSCGECVPFDVPADAQHPIWSADRLHGEALRIDRRATQAWSSALQPDGMGSCYPRDQPRESCGTRGSDHEMPVIVHDGIREQREWMLFEPFTHNLQEIPIILRPEKQRRRERRSMNYVKIAVGIRSSGGSQHGVGLCH